MCWDEVLSVRMLCRKKKIIIIIHTLGSGVLQRLLDKLLKVLLAIIDDSNFLGSDKYNLFHITVRDQTREPVEEQPISSCYSISKHPILKNFNYFLIWFTRSTCLLPLGFSPAARQVFWPGIQVPIFCVSKNSDLVPPYWSVLADNEDSFSA